MAIGEVTQVSPAYRGQDYTEGYLTQPALMANIDWKSLSFVGTLNAEAYTLRRGELTPGIYGEGYADRRHPHTLLHEAMLSWRVPGLNASGFSATISAGKGFAPYGTDDPMMRPFVKYPVNHHHSQVLERAQVTAAVGYARGARDVTIEYGVFNGDEPTDPFGNPTLSRLTDSRALRVTLRPRSDVELQASGAYITSPDIIQGGAADHRLLSGSARWQGTLSRGINGYAFAEFARNKELIPGNDGFVYETALVEGLASTSRFSIAARFERTERPEHERLLDPFRTPVGHIDFQLLGITRWMTTTLNVGGPSISVPAINLRLVPFVEVARAVPSAVVRPTVFEPGLFYGADRLWSYSAGLRVHFGSMRSRMGRYGAALPRVTAAHPASHH